MRDVAYVALGSNVGDRHAFLAFGRECLAALPQSAVETDLTPEELLAALHDIERAAGRVRRERWGPRTLDLDIVMFERQRIVTERLVVPHPELARRDFWHRELAELGANV